MILLTEKESFDIISQFKGAERAEKLCQAQLRKVLKWLEAEITNCSFNDWLTLRKTMLRNEAGLE